MDPATDAIINNEILRLGAGGAIAALLFFFYRKDVKQYSDLWKEQAALNMAQTKVMIDLVERNTASIATNTETLKSLHRRLDRAGYDRAQDREAPR